MTEGGAQGLAPGTVFLGRLRVERELRAGGMGAVYEVTHLVTRARQALKVIHPARDADPELRQRFHREMELSAAIRSDHIVTVHDAGFDDATGTPYLVMERLVGEDLGARAERGPVPAAEALALLHQLAHALERIHAAGVVHRDIKPGNLFVAERDDGSPLLKVLDFGIARRVVESTHTIERTAAIGTPGYMPPEQIDGDGDIGAEADLYALAQVAYTLLVGRSYWRDEIARSGMRGYALAARQGLPEPASVRAQRLGIALPPAFDAWFARATAPSPDERALAPLRLVEELGLALVPLQRRGQAPSPVPLQRRGQGPSLVPADDGGGPRGANWPRRWWLVPAALLALAAILVIGVVAVPALSGRAHAGADIARVDSSETASPPAPERDGSPAPGPERVARTTAPSATTVARPGGGARSTPLTAPPQTAAAEAPAASATASPSAVTNTPAASATVTASPFGRGGVQ